MITVIHNKNYIKNQKILYLGLTILSLAIMIFFYILYKIYFEKVYFIVIAALCAIPTALFCTRFILFLPHKDCNFIIANELLKLPPSCVIINTVLFTDSEHNKFIDNIIITGNLIICIVNKTNKYSENVIECLKNILDSEKANYKLKQIDLENYSFEHVNTLISNQAAEDKLVKIIKSRLI